MRPFRILLAVACVLATTPYVADAGIIENIRARRAARVAARTAARAARYEARAAAISTTTTGLYVRYQPPASNDLSRSSFGGHSSTGGAPSYSLPSVPAFAPPESEPMTPVFFTPPQQKSDCKACRVSESDPEPEPDGVFACKADALNPFACRAEAFVFTAPDPPTLVAMR